MLSARGAPAQDGWHPDVRSALELLRSGAFEDAERAAAFIARRANADELTREARTLAALAQMHQPVRETALAGRQALRDVLESDPLLAERAEVRYALGVAAMNLLESTESLIQLDAACERFEAQRNWARLADACVTLADAWLRYGEWEFGNPLLDESAPLAPRARELLRRERVRALRDKVQPLPGGDERVARIDLLRVRHLRALQDPDPNARAADEAAAARLLDQIVARRPVTPVIAEAMLLRSEIAADAGRGATAVDMLTELAELRLGRWSRTAAERVSQLTLPQVKLEADAHSDPHALLIRTRGLRQATLEVRRLDLAEWLLQRRGRFAETQLPASGAVQSVTELDLAGARQFDWTTPAPLELNVAAGAYVVVVEGQSFQGDPFSFRTLHIVDQESLHVLVRGQRMLIWPASAKPRTASVKFWMYGAFQPRTVALRDGVAQLPVPAEARVMRDRRWVCVGLDAAGAVTGLVTGEMTGDARRDRVFPEVLLTGGPTTVAPGAPIRVFGYLLGPDWDEPLTISLRSTLDEEFESVSVPVVAGRAFSAALRAPDRPQRRVRVVVSAGERVLSQVPQLFEFEVADESLARFRVDLDAPDALDPSQAGVVLGVRAQYPWLAQPASGFLVLLLRGALLPEPGSSGEPVLGRNATRYTTLDQDGAYNDVIPLEDLALPDGPLALEVSATVLGPDRRPQKTTHVLPARGAGSRLWIQPAPAQPSVGTPLTVRFGWFPDRIRAADATPTLTVTNSAGEPTAIPVILDRLGAVSDGWLPPASGRYTLRAALATPHGTPLVATSVVDVQADAVHAPPLRVERDSARVRIVPPEPVAAPTLVWIERDGQLGPARAWTPEQSAPLHAPHAVRPGRVFAARIVDGAFRILAGAIVPAQHADAHWKLRLPARFTVGGTATVTAEWQGADPPAFLFARLIRADAVRGYDWAYREDAILPPLREQGTHVTGPDHAGVPLATKFVPPAVLQAFQLAPTHWATALQPDAAHVKIDVPLPERAGVWPLEVIGVTEAGGVVRASALLDARPPVVVRTAFPHRLTVGDRLTGYVILENRTAKPQSVELTASLGNGLEVRAGATDAAAIAAIDAHEALTLDPQSTRTLAIAIEARETTTSHVDLRCARADAVIARAAHPYRVLAAPESPSDPQLVVDRLLYRVTPPAPTSTDPSVPPPADPWQRIPLDPGDRVPLGAYVLVREEIRASASKDVSWTQNASAHTRTFGGDVGTLHRLSAFERRLPDAWHWQPDLAPFTVHEYVLVPIHRGACRLPAPEILIAGKKVQVALTGWRGPLEVVEED